MSTGQDPVTDSPPLADISQEPVPDGSDIPTAGQPTDGIGEDPTPSGTPDAGTQPIDTNAV